MPLRDISLAVLDILGFGAMVRSQADVESFRESYLSVFRDDAVVSVAEPLAVRYHIYSDTIVIGSLADGPIPGIVNLFCFCRFLWTWALLRAFPLRGAVAYGKVLWDDDVKVGVPIEEAARAEEDQQWVGIMVCPSVLAKLHEDLNHFAKVAKNDLVKTEIPTKRGPLAGFALRPDVERVGVSREELVRVVERELLVCSSSDTQLKYQNTLRLIDESFQ